VAFIRTEDSAGSLWVMDANGANARQLTAPIWPGGQQFAWSPSGRSIAIGAGRRGVLLLDLPIGAERHIATPGIEVREVHWHPDEARLFVLDQVFGSVHLVSSGGAAPIELIHDRLTPRGHPNQVAVSPDAQYLALAATSEGLRVLDVTTRQLIPRVPNVDERAPVFSPDGRWLAVTRDSGVYIGPPDGDARSATRVGPALFASTPSVVFSPDSRRILIASDTAWLVDIESGETREIAWGPRTSPFMSWPGS
jgi:Tol biopolymer transport system component